MSTCHDEFEVLCALAASGDLSEAEHVALREHLGDCLSCRKYFMEMRRLAIPLLLARRPRNPGEHLRKDLQVRFAERAIREGIPLSLRSAGVSFSELGIVTVVLVVLLLVTATLQHAGRSSIVDHGVAAPARISASLGHPNSMMSFPAPPKVRRIRSGHKSGAFPVAKPRDAILEPVALSGHPFSFALYARSFARRTYPLSTTLKLTEVVPSLTFPSRAAGLTLDTAGPVSSTHLLSNLAAQRLDPDMHRNTWRANFKTTGFELIHDVRSETDGQESSQ